MSLDLYRQRFDEWKKLYPDKEKVKIIRECNGNWGDIYHRLNNIFRDDVWVPYRKEMEFCPVSEFVKYRIGVDGVPFCYSPENGSGKDKH